MNFWEKVGAVCVIVFSGALVALMTAVALLPYAAIGVLMFVGMRYLGWI